MRFMYCYIIFNHLRNVFGISIKSTIGNNDKTILIIYRHTHACTPIYIYIYIYDIKYAYLYHKMIIFKSIAHANIVSLIVPLYMYYIIAVNSMAHFGNNFVVI